MATLGLVVCLFVLVWAALQIPGKAGRAVKDWADHNQRRYELTKHYHEKAGLDTWD